jgi:hypothetical protein
LWFISNVTNINLSKKNIMSTPSLLLIPDRYKAGKLYSQLPDDGAGDLSFARASTATRVNAQGLIESVASGVPRLDYTGGGCPSLLLEPQRTNIVENSENTSAYSTFGSAFTQNTATSPQGSVNADTIAGNGVSVQIFGSTAITFPSAGAATISLFAKANNASFIDLSFDGFTGVTSLGIYDLTNGTATGTGASIQNYGNGWYRCILTATIDSVDLSGTLAIDVRPSVASQFWPSSGDANGKSVFVWGFQAELGSYVSSYIPTLGSSVTRLADVASKTSANAFFGTNTGTIAINFDSLGFDPTQGNYVFDLAAGADTTNRVLVYFSPSDNTLRLFYATTAGVTAQQVFSVTMSAIKKIAVKWTASDIKMFYNGTPTASFAFGTTAPNDLTLFARYTDSEHLAARTSQVLTFPTALTDAQCIELTAL